MKQILLYSPIWSFTAESFIERMNSLEKNEPVTIRANSPGGSVFAGWGMIRSLQEHTGDVIVKVDGIAASMMFYIVLFADKVEALDVSRFLIHRADGYVDNEDQKKELKTINDQIRAKLEKRINADLFQKTTGISYDEIFDENNRKDVWIGAKEAKKMGLVDKITRLEPKEIAAMEETILAFTESSHGSEEPRGSGQANDNNNNKLNQMTKQELKSQHPELYDSIFNEGGEAGKKAEQIRVKSWIAYLDVDKENVISAIKEGKEYTPDVTSEMVVKMQAKETKEIIEKDSTKKVSTSQVDEKTAEQKELEAYEKEVEEESKKIKIY